ncbi:hypothetical protein ACIRYZ_04150 [Kitasatospora sp. NPDC101155]|uniref:hypothetical protein n=1 Tax=Kitasatospora sp. NPDC101155 TaxID=3364097 RepID=UPI00380E3ED3
MRPRPFGACRCAGSFLLAVQERLDEVFAVNIRASFFVVQHGLKRLGDGGRITNISNG